jgi:hypothetical protein
MKFLSRFLRKKPEDPAQGSGASEQAAARPDQPSAPNPEELRLELGDFLHRIPAQLLTTAPHDLKAVLVFSISDLAKRLKRGDTTIPVSEIYRQLPGIFRAPLAESEPVEVRFPWMKVARLVNSAEAGTDAAASLAARIRDHIPGRNAKPAPAPAPEPEPVIRGRKSDQPSWFSKPTIERAAAPAASTPIDPPSSAPAVEARVPAGTSDPSPRTKPAPVPQPAADAEGEASSKERIRVALQGLMGTGQSQELQRQIALVQGEFERQLAISERLRANAIAESRSLREAVETASEKLAEEQLAANVSRELIQNASRERDTALRELAEARKALEAARDQDKISQLVAERDALLKQKAYLSAQVAEVSNKRTGNLPGKPGDPASSVPFGQPQRQIEEFQRRIALLEASQRETALELAREKEARAKAEKLLISAEKLQEESANYMESAKQEMRRELEASLKPREAEFRRAQKDLQDQNAVLSDQHRKATVELENARARLAELEPLAVSAPRIREIEDQLATALAMNRVAEEELDIARGRIGQLEMLEAEAAKARALQEELARFEDVNRLAAAELDEARSRIRQLEALAEETTEGGGLEDENAALRELQRHTAEELELARGRIAELAVQAAFSPQADDLQQQISALSEHNLSATTELHAARKRIAELEEAAAKPAARDPMQAQILAQLEEDIENYRSRLKVLIRERDAARADAAPAKDKEFAEVCAQFESRLAAEREASESRCEALRQALDAARDAAAAQLAAVERDRGAEGAEGGGATALREQARLFEQQTLLLTKERDELRMSHDELEARLKANTASHEQLLKSIEEEHAFTVRANKEMSERLAIAEQTKADLHAELARIAGDNRGSAADAAQQAEIASLRTELAEARREHEVALANARSQSDSLHDNETALTQLILEQQVVAANLGEAKAVLEDELATHRDLVAGLARNLETAEQTLSGMEAARATTEAANSVERERLAGTIAALSEERDRAIAARDSAVAALDQATIERERTAESLDGVRASAAAAREEAEQQIASARDEAGQLRAAVHALEAELAVAKARRGELEEGLATATREVGQLRVAASAFESELGVAKTRAEDFEQKLATAAHEAAQLRLAAETFESELAVANARAGALEQQLSATVGEADVLRAAAATFETDLASANARASELEQRIGVAENTRAELAQSIAASEAAAGDLRDKLARAEREAEAGADELSKLRGAAETAARDNEARRAKNTALQKKVAELAASLKANEEELELLRTALQREITHAAEESARFAAARDEALAQLATERTARENAIASVRARHEEHERNVVELARLRGELALLAAERDELARRVPRFSASPARDAASARPAADNIIEVTEIIETRVSNNLNIPRVRPVPVPPPKISSL